MNNRKWIPTGMRLPNTFSLSGVIVSDDPSLSTKIVFRSRTLAELFISPMVLEGFTKDIVVDPVLLHEAVENVIKSYQMNDIHFTLVGWYKPGCKIEGLFEVLCSVFLKMEETVQLKLLYCYYL